MPCLEAGELCVLHLAATVNAPETSGSHGLRLLRTAGIVRLCRSRPRSRRRSRAGQFCRAVGLYPLDQYPSVHFELTRSGSSSTRRRRAEDVRLHGDGVDQPARGNVVLRRRQCDSRSSRGPSCGEWSPTSERLPRRFSTAEVRFSLLLLDVGEHRPRLRSTRTAGCTQPRRGWPMPMVRARRKPSRRRTL